MKLHRSHIKCTYLLDLLQYINIFLGLGSLNWRQYFRGGLKCLTQGKNHFASREVVARAGSKLTSSKSYALGDTAQDAAGFHCCKGTLGSCSTCCHQDLFSAIAFQPAAPGLFCCMGLVYPRCRTLHWLLRFLMRFASLCTSLALLPINCCLWFGVCEYAEVALHPILQVLSKDA